MPTITAIPEDELKVRQGSEEETREAEAYCLKIWKAM
jgi:hypothetical protein